MSTFDPVPRRFPFRITAAALAAASLVGLINVLVYGGRGGIEIAYKTAAIFLPFAVVAEAEEWTVSRARIAAGIGCVLVAAMFAYDLFGRRAILLGYMLAVTTAAATLFRWSQRRRADPR